MKDLPEQVRFRASALHMLAAKTACGSIRLELL